MFRRHRHRQPENLSFWNSFVFYPLLHLPDSYSAEQVRSEQNVFETEPVKRRQFVTFRQRQLIQLITAVASIQEIGNHSATKQNIGHRFRHQQSNRRRTFQKLMTVQSEIGHVADD